jgi:hypothetical protein
MSVNTDQKIIKNKVGLLSLAEMLGSVSEACKVMGYSRDRLLPLSMRKLPVTASIAVQQSPSKAPFIN